MEYNQLKLNHWYEYPLESFDFSVYIKILYIPKEPNTKKWKWITLSGQYINPLTGLLDFIKLEDTIPPKQQKLINLKQIT